MNLLSNNAFNVCLSTPRMSSNVPWRVRLLLINMMKKEFGKFNNYLGWSYVAYSPQWVIYLCTYAKITLRLNPSIWSSSIYLGDLICCVLQIFSAVMIIRIVSLSKRPKLMGDWISNRARQTTYFECFFSRHVGVSLLAHPSWTETKKDFCW